MCSAGRCAQLSVRLQTTSVRLRFARARHQRPLGYELATRCFPQLALSQKRCSVGVVRSTCCTLVALMRVVSRSFVPKSVPARSLIFAWGLAAPQFDIPTELRLCRAVPCPAEPFHALPSLPRRAITAVLLWDSHLFWRRPRNPLSAPVETEQVIPEETAQHSTGADIHSSLERGQIGLCALVQTTDAKWMTRGPGRCRYGHHLTPRKWRQRISAGRRCQAAGF